MEIQKKTGFLIFRPNLLAHRIQFKHTIVACGSSRGGTSSISYALAQAGVYLGPTADLNHEDTDIVKSIRDKAALRRIFAERNKTHDTWGFKVPEAAFYLDWLDIELRNPIMIYVMRNPASVARSIMARDPVYGSGMDGFSGALNHGLRYYNHFTETMRRIQSPIILVEYEAIVHSPAEFAKDFFSCLNIPLSDATIAEIAENISVPGYKPIAKPSVEA